MSVGLSLTFTRRGIYGLARDSVHVISHVMLLGKGPAPG
jgi:hypothetical protein